MSNKFIEVVETEIYFNKCSCCKSEKETKKVVIGNALRTNAFVLCKECRADLYYKLEKSLKEQQNDER